MNKSSDTNAPLVSVVMPTYNGQEFIAEAIQSILDQTFRDFEFIIIDDGSTDSTAGIVASFQDKRIVYIKKKENSGIANSLNQGIQKARGKYIARMDDDDVSLPQRLEKQIEVFKDNKVLLCATAVYVKERILPIPITHDAFLLRLLFYNPIAHPSVMIKSEILKHFLYKPDFVPLEDYELWSRLIFNGNYTGIQEPLLEIRQRKEGSTGKWRKKQLELSKEVTQKIYEKTNLSKLKDHDVYYPALVSQDYSLSGRQLRKLIIWTKSLKRENQTKGVFIVNEFNQVLEEKLQKYLHSYFKNKTIRQKILPFLYLSLYYKRKVLKFYF